MGNLRLVAYEYTKHHKQKKLLQVVEKADLQNMLLRHPKTTQKYPGNPRVHLRPARKLQDKQN